MSVTYKPDKRFHAAANLFPLMKDTDPRRWVEFCGSIAKAGLLEPIVLLEDEILDGRNRYLACIETNTPPEQALNVQRDAPELLPNVQRGELTLVDASNHAVEKRDGSQIRNFADIKLKNEPVDPVARIMRQVHKLSRINFIALTSCIRDFAAHVYPDMSCVMPTGPNKDVVVMAREAQPPQREREPGEDESEAAV